MKKILFLLLIVLPFLLKQTAPVGAILPVQHEGRVKPLDTVARTAKVLLQGKEGVQPSAWLLEVLFDSKKALKTAVIKNDHPDLFADSYLSMEQIQPRIDDIYKQVDSLLRANPKEPDSYQQALLKLWQRIEIFTRLTYTVQLNQPLPDLPYFNTAAPDGFDTSVKWKNRGEDFTSWKNFTRAWPDLSEEVTAYMGKVHEENPSLARALKLELFFNTLQPFFVSKVYYVIAAILFLFLGIFRKGLQIPSLFVYAGFIFHTAGIILRMTIEGRPPVTNLYSSALFVGWGGVLAALLFSRKESALLPVASVIGFATLSISTALSLNGDTMEMMRAVLDSNFWLTTHVITITLGYSATFLTGFMAAYALLFQSDLKATTDTVYRVLSLALLLTFIGTLLGGIWADQSWGRFWGWDPKENGALMIVLWNSIIIHARMGRYVQELGFLRLAVFGNVVTSFAWFGVNMLGVGLHSYGFMDQAFLWLFLFVAANFAIILTPRRWLVWL